LNDDKYSVLKEKLENHFEVPFAPQMTNPVSNAQQVFV